MDIATCTLDGITYTSYQFTQLDYSELSEKRRCLICPECKAPAFFRKQTRNGRAACFGARPHQPGCKLSELDEMRVIQAQGEIAEIIDNPGERIVVDLSFGAHQYAHAEPCITVGHGKARARIHIGSNNGKRNRMSRRLSSLLRTLIESPGFSSSQQIIEIFDKEIEVRDFFIHLLEINDQHLDTIKGIWGMLSDIARDQQGNIWLNSGGKKNISFLLNEQSFKQICRRFKINDEEEFSGSYILAIGTAKKSQKGKIYCSIDNPNMIFFRIT